MALTRTGLFQRAADVIPGGVNSPVRAWGAVRAGEPFFAARGWLDERQAAVEGLTAIKRAVADVIVSYWARELAEWL